MFQLLIEKEVLTMTVTKFESKLVELHSPAIWFVHNYGIIKLNYYSVVIYKNGRSLLDVTTGGFFVAVGF